MDKSDPSDADLVAQTLAGNQDAFARLYDRHARLVRAVLFGVSLEWSALDDLVQECFLRAYRNLRVLRDPQRFGAWIVGIARQVARERKRSMRRDRHKFLGEQLPDTHSTDDGWDALEHAEQLELLLRSTAELPERERVAIHAFFLSERDARQAAELLGLSRSGLYALLGRALARLAALVMPPGSEKES
jgi:RNA polymerase sigma-70 factor, ECF subfamily